MLASILIFIVVLSVLVLVHELGHYIMAKRAGVWVEEFGFGLPPRIFGKKIGETLFSINALPFGGFVKLHGESSEDGVSDPKRAFLNKSKMQRIGIVVAGVFMNFILAIVAFMIVYSFSGIPRETGKLKVVDVVSGSPAQSSGVLVGDIISKVGTDSINTTDDFISKVGAVKGKNTPFEITRNVNGEEKTIKVQMKPRETPPQGEGPLGVIVSTVEIYFPPVWQRPFYGIYYGFKEAVFWGKTIAVGLWDLVLSAFRGKVDGQVSGPVGIFAVTTEAAKNGLLTLINFVGILSVNLAVLNIVPFPALDGGRLLFIGIESILGKKVLPKVESAIHTVGMVFLLLLFLAITIGDVRKLIEAGGIDGFLKSMVK